VVTYRSTTLEHTCHIGEGRYRDVYAVGNEAVKVIKQFIRKDYGLFRIDYPAPFYIKHKFGIEDFNRFELDSYNQLMKHVPPGYTDSFSRIHRVVQKEGRSISISDLIRDSDGTLSKSLSDHGPVKDLEFWRRMSALRTLLLDNEIHLMDITGENIMVKKTEEYALPVIVDYKRYGTNTYPFQFWMLSKNEREKRIQRRFMRLRRFA
jgi:hypothetical protein